MTTTTFQKMAHDLSRAGSLEQTSRLLLDVLGRATGLDCVYVARLDRVGYRHRVQFAHQFQSQGVVVSEGASAAWDETLCKRAVEQGVQYTPEADRLWTHNARATTLGICTYMNHSIWDRSGTLLGALSGVSNRRVPMAHDTPTVLRLFAEVIGCSIERDQILTEAQERYESRVSRAFESRRDALDAPGVLQAHFSRVLESTMADDCPAPTRAPLP